MSTRSIFEFNHDMSDAIRREPDKFLQALHWYLNSACEENAQRLERYGMRLAWWGHHSDERKVVTKYSETKL